MGFDRVARAMPPLVLAGIGASGLAAWHAGAWFALTLAGVTITGFVLAAAVTVDRPRPRRAAMRAEAVDRILVRAMLDQAPTPLLAVEDGRVRALNRAARDRFAADDTIVAAPPALDDPAAARLTWEGRAYRIDRVVASGRTLVALVDVEREERTAEARATRELVETMGHELANGIAPIVSLAESAVAVLDRPERRDVLLPEILGTLARQAAALQRFTAAYRMLARLPDPSPRPVAVADLLADLARMFAARGDGRIALSVAPPPDIALRADRDQIVQALWALVENAAVAARSRVRLSAAAEDGGIAFHVEDDGAGFVVADMARVFRAFHTTRAGGSGIGLGLARQIARAHGGDVRIAKPADDTVVVLAIPVDSPEPMLSSEFSMTTPPPV